MFLYVYAADQLIIFLNFLYKIWWFLKKSRQKTCQNFVRPFIRSSQICNLLVSKFTNRFGAELTTIDLLQTICKQNRRCFPQHP
jgi:hypothetical protein